MITCASLLLAASILLAACGADENVRGRALYRQQGCHACHGDEGQGLQTAPPLRDLDRHWDRERLARYLLNPRAFLERNERLKEMHARYGLEMPGLPLGEEDRAALADLLLEWE